MKIVELKEGDLKAELAVKAETEKKEDDYPKVKMEIKLKLIYCNSYGQS